jgi:hypothetical protein
MTVTFKLERPDGTPAESAVDAEHRHKLANGDTIRLGRDRSLRVVGIVVSNDDEPSVLIVEDVS